MSPRARRTLVLLALGVAALCARLGFWQRSRLHQRRARNAEVSAQRALPEVDLAAPGRPPLAERRVTARGSYDPGHEMLLRTQVDAGTPGVHVITPLRLPGQDSALLVDRGFLPSPDGLQVVGLDRLAEPGEVTVRGLALPLAPAPRGGAPLERDGHLSWQALDPAGLAERLPFPVLPVVVLQAPDSALPKWPRRVAPRPLDDGPHLSYMLQWWAFATIALVGAVTVSRAGRARRSSGPTDAPSAGAAPPPPPPAGTP